MPLVTSEQMLLDAQKGGYAVGAFNVENMEMVKAVIAAAEELCAPVMLQTTPSTVKYGSLDTYFGIVAAEAKKATVPVCLHLDHGSSFELAVQAIKAGYTSVMIDGSHENFEDNIAVSKKVVDVAKACGIPVEAELGKVGGKEDDLEAEADTNTDPAEAIEFAERTGVSSTDSMQAHRYWIRKESPRSKKLFRFLLFFTGHPGSAMRMSGNAWSAVCAK